MVIKSLRNLRHRLLSNLFQKDGSTAAKLLCWTVEVGTRAIKQRNFPPGIEETKLQRSWKLA